MHSCLLPILNFQFLGCADPKKCKCNIMLSPIKSNLSYILGKNDTLTVPFTLSNSGIEPSIGSKIDFRFSGQNFELVEDPKYSCKKTLPRSSGANNLETKVSKKFTIEINSHD